MEQKVAETTSERAGDRAPAQPILADPLSGIAELRQSDTEQTSARHDAALEEDLSSIATKPAEGDDERQQMTTPRARQDSLFPFLLITLPVAVSACFAVAFGWMELSALLLILVTSGLGAMILLRRHRAHLGELIGYLDKASSRPQEAPGDPPAPLGSLLTGELTGAIVETLRKGRRWHRDLAVRDAGKEAVLAALPYPLLTMSAGRRVTRANRAAQELFDSPLEGRNLITVLREPDLLAAAEAVLAGAEGRTIEFTIAGGLTRYFVAHIRRLAVTQEDETIAILALLEVTPLKRAEQLRADFVANASHELKTPLASLMGFIETLGGAARNDPEARKRFLPIMHEQSERMAHLVEDLLSLSRIELHEHTPPQGSVDVQAVLGRVTAALSITAEQRGIRLRLLCDDLPHAQGEEEELQQVFQNLVDNALKYGRANSEVTVEARLLTPEEARLHRLGRPAIGVSVIDEGEGIAREHLARLTERFYRVDTARSRALGGTGLGLAIVKHIVNRHRGRLEIKSDLGKGSVFSVYLRAAGGQPKAAEDPHPQEQRARAVGE